MMKQVKTEKTFCSRKFKYICKCQARRVGFPSRLHRAAADSLPLRPFVYKPAPELGLTSFD